MVLQPYIVLNVW